MSFEVKSECSWDEAYELLSHSIPQLPHLSASLRDSIGRVAASEVRAASDLPAYLTSSMDGWALRGAGPWKSIGEIHAGVPLHRELQEGEAVRIATGGVIPAGADSILPWEDATVADSLISGTKNQNSYFRPAGAECRAGEIICNKGILITPAHVGLFAAAGLDQIEISSKPKVSLFYLGDELIHSGKPHDGKIRDALGVQLPYIVEKSGCELIQEQFVVDGEKLLISEVEKSLAKCDLIITTGGTADGPRDFVKPMFAALGATLLIDRVRVRPGYHVLISRVALHGGHNVILVALPGNPQSAIAAYTAFVLPIIDSLIGLAPKENEYVVLSGSISAPKNFCRHIPGKNIDGKFHPAEYLGSAMLRGLTYSSGFALVNPGINEAESQVRWLPLKC